MSEVKRLQRYSRDFNGNLSKDPNGDWILFGDAAEREGLLTGKIAAQRLRADTAEAELSRSQNALLAARNGLEFHQDRADAAEQRIVKMEAALKYYADKDHFSTDDGMNWDSCSGEPSNILWHEEQPWFIEDGSIARAALNPNPEAESHERLCPGCGAKGWTANCDQCIPY